MSAVEPGGLPASSPIPNGAEFPHHRHSESAGDVLEARPFRFPDPIFASELASGSAPSSASSHPRSFLEHEPYIFPPSSGPTKRAPYGLAQPSTYSALQPNVPVQVASPHETMSEWAPVHSPGGYWQAHGNHVSRTLQEPHRGGTTYPPGSLWTPGGGEGEAHPLPGDQTQLLDPGLSPQGFSGLPAPSLIGFGPSSLPSWFSPGPMQPPTHSFAQNDSQASSSTQEAQRQRDARQFAAEERRGAQHPKQPRYPPRQDG